ncbi:MAG: GTPase [DPANN group archaeon]|nr:GTPase [DPANN group archaeon]
MANFWKVVNKVIRDADVLLLVLDARMVEETRHAELEAKVRREGKPLIYVVSKADLVQKEKAERYKRVLHPCVFISATKHLGTTLLRNRILIEAKKRGLEKVKVGVLGYPNVGKSSLINALKGRKAASTSILSGHTKGVQKIKADRRIILLDTPGVIPYKENTSLKHAFIGTLDFTKVKEPDVVVGKLMERFPGTIESWYEVSPDEDPENVLEAIARKRNVLKRGNVPDTQRMATMILKDWQKGTIR